jgi:hypothetical protein
LCFAIADQIPSCILFYPYGTPKEIKAEAKAVIVQSGGKILYEYSKYLHFTSSAISSLAGLVNTCSAPDSPIENFNGFAATIPPKAVDSVRKLGNPQINEDQIMQLDGEKGSDF